MGIFDDSSSLKRMKDPEERKAKDLERSNKKARGYRNKKSSVTLNQVKVSKAIAKTVSWLIVCGVVGVALYFGIQMYING